MNKLHVFFAACLALLVMQEAGAQNRVNVEKHSLVWTMGGREPRITVEFGSKGINIGGYEDVAPIIENNFSNELLVKLEFTLTDFCGESKTYKVNKQLKAHERYAPSPFFEGFSFETKCKETKKFGNKGELRTRIYSIHHTLVEIRDLTAEKKKAEEERLAAEQKAAAEKAAREKAAQEKAVKEKAEKEALAKKAAEEKAAKEAEAKKQAAAKKAQARKAAAAEGTASAAATTSGSGATSQANRATAGTEESDARTKEQERIAAQEAARQAAREQEEARKREEEQQRRERQQAYDQWKAQKQQERQQMESASAAASIGVLYILGSWIYNDKMGNVNPEYIYMDNRKTQMSVGIEYGYSATVFPMIFKSSTSTMVDGQYEYDYSLEKVGAFTANLDVKVKVGAEHEQYGGFAYFYPKAGFSPIFDASQLSIGNFGFKGFGGLKWVKGYIDYTTGGRTFTKSSHDPEESGEGRSSFGFSKLQYGLRFTTKADYDYRRSHISVGVISEKLKPNDMFESGYADPQTNAIMQNQKSPAITGYAFEWKKDHHFALYANVYPNYIYSGEVSHKGGPSTEFRDKTTGLFVEVGFLRSVDWWFGGR